MGRGRRTSGLECLPSRRPPWRRCARCARSLTSDSDDRRPRPCPADGRRSAARSRTPRARVLPGVTVEARSNVLPAPRVTVTDGDGANTDLPALPPGDLHGEASPCPGMQRPRARRERAARAGDDRRRDPRRLRRRGDGDGDRGGHARRQGQRDHRQRALQRGDPAPCPSPRTTATCSASSPRCSSPATSIRGPSGGGSGQDNVYQFDGVNVTLPLFGTLSAEPASHDIDQVTVDPRRRARHRLRALRRLLHGLGEQVGHQRVPRAAQLPAHEQGHGRGAGRGRPVALRAGPRPG